MGANIGKVSSDLIEFVKSKEGFESKVYVCPSGYMTIGYGFRFLFEQDNDKCIAPTIKVATLPLNRVMTKSEGEWQLKRWLLYIKRQVASRLGTEVINNLQDYQLEALTSIAYNTGVAGLFKNTELINGVKTNPNSLKIRSLIKNVSKNNKSLVRRREEEANFYYGGGANSSSNDSGSIRTASVSEQQVNFSNTNDCERIVCED